MKVPFRPASDDSRYSAIF